jgi:hypothetical protein
MIVVRLAGHRIREFPSPKRSGRIVQVRSPKVLTESSGEHLVGQWREREMLDRLVDATISGRAGVLVMHGAP